MTNKHRDEARTSMCPAASLGCFEFVSATTTQTRRATATRTVQNLNQKAAKDSDEMPGKRQKETQPPIHTGNKKSGEPIPCQRDAALLIPCYVSHKAISLSV